MRLAELIGTLSLAIDAGTGLPDYHSLRSASVAVGLARELGLDDRSVRDTFYLPLLVMAGCTAGAHSSAKMLGDEVGIGGHIYGLDWGDPKDMMPAMLRNVRSGHSLFAGVAATLRAFGAMSEAPEVARAHCEVATHVAERFGFDREFCIAVAHGFERWNGTGKPHKLKGESIALVTRVALVAVDANIGHYMGGVDGAIGLTRKHAGKGLDPSIVERFGKVAKQLCAPLDEPSAWAAALASEPAPWLEVDEAGTEEGLRATAHFADLKSCFTRHHSTGVASLARAAAERAGLGADVARNIGRAGLLHDVGRVATSAAIWDKAKPLTDTEREKIRLHSYVSERVLSRAPSLAAVAELASVAHERLDGAGYHRRLPAAACTAPARLLAAADVYRALCEPRPQRPAFDADRAATELLAMAKRSELCPDAVAAVLGAAGHVTRPAERPRGLTDREVEVLKLLTLGLTNKEIATKLDIATKTAGHHVQHVLEKLGVTTRAAATMIAMKAGIAPG